MALSATNLLAQDSIEASRALHESIVLHNEWSQDRGPDLCNMNKFLEGLNNGGDLNSQSSIYHQKKIHQNVLNRSIAFGCTEIAEYILTDESNSLDQDDLKLLVNDPNRALNTSPIKRTINKDYVVLFELLLNNSPVEINFNTIAKKIVNKNRFEMARILIQSKKLKSLDSIYGALKTAVLKDKAELTKTFLSHKTRVKRLSPKKVKKILSLVDDQNSESAQLLKNY